MMKGILLFVLAAASFTSAVAVRKPPDYFQTSPELNAGPTATGSAPFLAQTNPAPFPGVSYIPPSPLETQVPIQGKPADVNIFRMFGQLSPYFPNPSGFGVDEYALPKGANITKLFMLHRHGSRYPTSNAPVRRFSERLANSTTKFTASGDLSFLNDYKYNLGTDILVPIGKQELFNSGTQHYYQYGHLYPNNGKKIIARSTTQDRMTQSAEYFLAGFFGLGWTENATLEVIIDKPGFNNSLAGYYQCPNSPHPRSKTGTRALGNWARKYLVDATKRIQSMIEPHDFLDLADVYNMQSLCAYETIAFGYSHFCGLFTYEEWQGYEYSVDLQFYGDSSWGSPTGRAVGIGYVQELLARLENHYITEPTAQVNVTLDSMASTFPLDQTLYFDFSHDTNMAGVLTAFGLTQFNRFLPDSYRVPHEQMVSHMEPFAARLDIELIETPQPLQSDPAEGYAAGGQTTYIHFLLNQRTIPLHASYKQCAHRHDGWCRLEDFLEATKSLLEEAQYEYACFGDYPVTPYGKVSNGVPVAEDQGELYAQEL